MNTIRALVAHWGYFAIFAFVVLGNIGVPVPENSVLWVAGYLVWKGRLALGLVLAVGVIGAVVGDNIGFWIGRRYGQTAVDRYGGWIHLTPPRLERMRRFVHRFGPVGVFIARFVTGLRFMAGPLAGSLGLSPAVFFVANVLGAICYVPVMVGAGYAVGYGFRQYAKRFLLGPDTLEDLLLLGTACLAIVVVVFQGVRFYRNRNR
ncbi:MAG TPA: DedA family protein [Candidatus Baltobacteraceae bacterium]|nr:DedA family protein [Candidatus Baltobacteraceae bacterium]